MLGNPSRSLACEAGRGAISRLVYLGGQLESIQLDTGRNTYQKGNKTSSRFQKQKNRRAQARLGLVSVVQQSRMEQNLPEGLEPNFEDLRAHKKDGLGEI